MLRASLTLFLIFFAAAHTANAETGKIRFMVEENPPYNFRENRIIQGLAVDLLVAMTKTGKQPITADSIELIPLGTGL